MKTFEQEIQVAKASTEVFTQLRGELFRVNKNYLATMLQIVEKNGGRKSASAIEAAGGTADRMADRMATSLGGKIDTWTRCYEAKVRNILIFELARLSERTGKKKWDELIAVVLAIKESELLVAHNSWGG
jgi:hypothetical protein